MAKPQTGARPAVPNVSLRMDEELKKRLDAECARIGVTRIEALEAGARLWLDTRTAGDGRPSPTCSLCGGTGFVEKDVGTRSVRWPCECGRGKGQ